MKKFTLLSAVAAVGLLGVSANAAKTKTPTGYDAVQVKTVVLMQGADTVSGSKTKFNVTKMKITNDDIFNLINDEFGTSYSTEDGDLLLVHSFLDGTIYVSDSSGTVYGPYSEGEEDDYYLDFNWDELVYTGSEGAASSKRNFTTNGELDYRSGDDESYIYVDGLTKVKDTYKTSSYKESFKMKGLTGSLYFDDGDTTGVFSSGKIKGSGTGVPLS